jgi:hypothetical protein
MTTHEMARTTPRRAVGAAPPFRPVQRLGATTGVLGFALAIGAIVVSATTGTVAANPGAPAEEVARAYANAASPLVWVGAMLQILALLCLFGFATYLAGALSRDQDGADWLRRLTAGAGQTFVGLTLAGFAIGSMARFRAGPGLDISAAMALFDVHVGLYVASWAMGAAFMTAAAASGLRSKALPGWLCVAAACVAAVDLSAVALPTSPLASFPNLLMWLWSLAASMSLLLRPAPTSAAEGARP